MSTLVIVLTGCLSIKEQGLSQPRAPGVVTLGGVICGSDYNRTSYPGCDGDASDGTGPVNVAERDKRPEENSCDADGHEDDPPLCPGLTDTGQLLVGFRVPIGSEGPAGFLTDVNDLQLNQKPSYTQELQEMFPAPAGEHWVGYISTVREFASGPDAFNPTGIHPEFTLPPQPDGGPFPGPYRWRWVVGFRRISAANAGSPVGCGGPFIFCVDSPPPGQVHNSLPAESVSDFGVRPGTSAAAGHGETATVAFPVEYLDGRGLGQRELSIAATTNVPGTTATPSVKILSVDPNTTSTINVSVPVPPGTPLGPYTVTLSAATGNPAVTRSNSATITVVDKLAPSIRVSVPARGARFVRGRSVAADYACTEEPNGSGIRGCAGPVGPGAAIDTGSVGTKTFTVNASDNAGNAATLTHTYRVVRPPARRISAKLSYNYRAFRRFTVLTRLQVKKVPRGATVKAKCARKKRRCPGKARKSFTKRRARGKVSLNKRYKRVRLRAGTKITVRVTKRRRIGAVKILKIRRAKAPKVIDRCLPPGSRKPRRRC